MGCEARRRGTPGAHVTKQRRIPVLGVHPLGAQWAVLLFFSILFILGLEAVHVPAAILLGSMIGAIVVAAVEGKVRVATPVFHLAQGMIGCLIARGIPRSILAEMTRDWPLFFATVLSVIVVTNLIGWMLTRWRVLPGTTAIWGSFPGAATPMVLMAEAYGADFRLVAFMQYTRVASVAIVASAVASIFISGKAGAVAIDWFPPVAWLSLVETLALSVSGLVLTRFVRIPAGALVVPMVLGVILQDLGVMTIELPTWLLAISYTLLGWSIGLRFTRPILLHAARAAPRVLMTTAALIAICALAGAASRGGGRYRSAHGLSRDESGRRGLRGDHRGVVADDRYALRHGDAGRAPSDRSSDRTAPRALHREAGRRRGRAAGLVRRSPERRSLSPRPSSRASAP